MCHGHVGLKDCSCLGAYVANRAGGLSAATSLAHRLPKTSTGCVANLCHGRGELCGAALRTHTVCYWEPPRCALTLFAIGSLSAHVPVELSKSACQALLMFYWHGTERVAPENDDSLGRLP